MGGGWATGGPRPTALWSERHGHALPQYLRVRVRVSVRVRVRVSVRVRVTVTVRVRIKG